MKESQQEIYKVALCDYQAGVGWRVRAMSRSVYQRPGMFRFGGIKLLRVNTDLDIKNGQFIRTPDNIRRRSPINT